ncbi:MAG: cell envelope integrity protein TolA [Candidatus Berkiellales bacterium]
MPKNRVQSISFMISCAAHVLIGLLFLLSFDRTITLPAHPSDQAEPKIIDAVVVNHTALKEEVARLEAIEAKKREKEIAREQAIKHKEQEAKEKRIKEEKLATELKKQNEQLKKEAQLAEKEHQEKLKAEEQELKKIQKEKAQALVAKEKAEKEKKAAELAKQKAADAKKEQEEAEENTSQAGAKVNEDEITRHAQLIKTKIHQHWRQPIGFDIKGLKCKVSVKLMPTGEVIDVRIVQSSGNLEFDRSTELAVRKASPLPMPENNHVAKQFREFDFTFNPESV